ncbi:hypothetical protein GGI12_001391 [Dipsacomyces acuminosporus]|nr:hypothetical protein GGI12_001391 [Dipsacomyces acuminosporus]
MAKTSARGKAGRGRGRGRGGTKRVPARSTVAEQDAQKPKRAKPNSNASDYDGAEDIKEVKGIESIAKKCWLGKSAKWSSKVVDEIMTKYIAGDNFAKRSLQTLERLQYFEKYLWSNFDPATASDTQVVSILVMLNEKHQERLTSTLWSSFTEPEPSVAGEEDDSASDMKPKRSFSTLFDCVIDLALNKILKQQPSSEGMAIGGVDPVSARSILTQFLIVCFSSLETPFVREACMGLVSLSIWNSIDSQPLVEAEFSRTPQLRKFWKHLSKKLKPGKKNDPLEVARLQHGRDFLSLFVKDFLAILFQSRQGDMASLAYVSKFIELLVDLESQLPTRRYVNLLLIDHQVIDLCQVSQWYQNDKLEDRKSQRFRELVAQLRRCIYFQVSDVTGQALTEAEAKDVHYNKLIGLQMTAFKEFPNELESLAVSSVARLGKPTVLIGYLESLEDELLLKLASVIGVRTRSVLPQSVSADIVDGNGNYSRRFILDAIAERYMRRPTVADQVRRISPYPSERLLFDDIIKEMDQYGKQPASAAYFAEAKGHGSDEDKASTDKSAFSISYPVLPIPKLNLQFLTLHDYFARNFELFRLETAYEIREDVEDAVRRLQPRMTYDPSADMTVAGGQAVNGSSDVNNTHFAGWARMAIPIHSFSIVDVQKPRIGESAPSKVRADLSIDLGNYVESVRQEWITEVRPRDVLILVAVQATKNTGEGSTGSSLGIRYIRGGEIECKLDINGKPIDEFASRLNPQETRADRDTAKSSVCNFRLLLDPSQHYADNESQHEEDVYASFNVVMRRRPQENNFKAVLEAVRDLMLSPQSLPDWFAPTFLGYGEPASATALSLRPLLAINTGGEDDNAEFVRVNFGDTFLSESHLRESFSEYGAIALDGEFAKPCIVEFPVDSTVAKDKQTIRVSSLPATDMGPLELRKPKENAIRFTPAQVSAIHSASLPGLTLVVGPPGTGKTDVAVQMISNLYHAFPKQNVLLITHSNQALNQLFEKIIALDIEPRHLLRLGHGEEELDSEERYSKAGRVESYLERRKELLDIVQRLAESMGIKGDFGYTCETARLFFISHVRVRWEPYRRKIGGGASAAEVIERFPFASFFEQSLERPLFSEGCEDVGELVRVAEGCYRYIEGIFDELGDIQPFELLRTNHERSNYLLTNQARIVAMTCTHAALKRRELIKLGFRYDNVVMEEAAQVLDIETFIPLVLQAPSNKAAGMWGRKLKRIVMIGDHNQLPPVVKNTGLRAFANMEQSMFTRMVRLGVPYVELNKQARARPAIASLYRYRYEKLGDLEPGVTQGEFAKQTNSGFKHVFQFVDVGDFKGKGETEPTKYYYQNLGEAEYVVAVYQYMRLLGYPAESIAILTTYNGQRALIQDVLNRRCGWLPYFGKPRAISTVDQYQGQQSDYVLLSLVRTKAVGHIRDLRRLTVALSRSRLGLYVFGRRSLFETCFELQESMGKLLANGDQLAICPEERYGQDGDASPRAERSVEDVAEMGQLVFEMLEEYVEANGSPTATEAIEEAGSAESGTNDVEADQEAEEEGQDKEDEDKAEEDSGDGEDTPEAQT